MGIGVSKPYNRPCRIEIGPKNTQPERIAESQPSQLVKVDQTFDHITDLISRSHDLQRLEVPLRSKITVVLCFIIQDSASRIYLDTIIMFHPSARPIEKKFDPIFGFYALFTRISMNRQSCIDNRKGKTELSVMNASIKFGTVRTILNPG